MRLLRLPLVLILAVLAVPAPAGHAAAAGPRRERRLVVFYTAEVHGTPEPCGCTAEPLGGISRLAGLVRTARRGANGVLLLDGGDLLYAQPKLPGRERGAADATAAFLAAELDRLGLAGAAVGETDLAGGPGAVKPPRLAANLKQPFVRPGALVEAGGIKVGLVGLADPALDGGSASATNAAMAAVRDDAARLRSAGAELVFALAAVERPLARRVAREAPVDFVLVGKRVGDGMPRAEAVGNAFLISPADELRRVGRLEIVLREPGAVKDAGGSAGRSERKSALDRKLRELDGMLQKWARDATADRAFVAQRQRERDALAAERTSLEAPFTPPAQGNYFVNELVPLGRSLARDARTLAAERVLDRKVAALNLAAAAPPPAPEPGRAAYVGVDNCRSCHTDAYAAWRSSHHAGAWKTLTAVGKQADYRCVRCHSTGFGQVGGASLGHLGRLEAVQCEACHGPGSLHAANPADKDSAPIARRVPESVCVDCHNEHHSDSFQYTGYLRDILGPKHGEDARKKLGDGPGAKELRAARKAAVNAAAPPAR